MQTFLELSKQSCNKLHECHTLKFRIAFLQWPSQMAVRPLKQIIINKSTFFFSINTHSNACKIFKGTILRFVSLYNTDLIPCHIYHTEDIMFNTSRLYHANENKVSHSIRNASNTSSSALFLSWSHKKDFTSPFFYQLKKAQRCLQMRIFSKMLKISACL